MNVRGKKEKAKEKKDNLEFNMTPLPPSSGMSPKVHMQREEHIISHGWLAETAWQTVCWGGCSALPQHLLQPARKHGRRGQHPTS